MSTNKSSHNRKSNRIQSTKKLDKDLDLIDKLKQQVEQLKRELKSTRKLLDRYQVAEQKGLIDDNGLILRSKKRIQQDEEELENKNRWKCYDCKRGFLEIVIFGNRYFRLCNECGKRTKSQIWDESVDC